MDPFCDKQAYGKTIFYESKHFMALYDIRPVVAGHVLIIPKRHVVDVIELTKEEVEDMHSAFSKVIPKILGLYDAQNESYDLTSQVGPYSGRTVPHLHFHILPRRKDDIYQKAEGSIYEDIKHNRTNFSTEAVMQEVKKLRKEFGYTTSQR